MLPCATGTTGYLLHFHSVLSRPCGVALSQQSLRISILKSITCITTVTIMATIPRLTRFTGLAIFTMMPDLLIAILSMLAIFNTLTSFNIFMRCTSFTHVGVYPRPKMSLLLYVGVGLINIYVLVTTNCDLQLKWKKLARKTSEESHLSCSTICVRAT